MRDKILLSIILPIYNGEKTLGKCIESILQEKYINLELICVDDESTDKSLLLCKCISENDSRVRIVTKKNGGVASARNIGMRVAKGIFITFVDQDDWIEKNTYKIMLEQCINEQADMVVCNYFKDYTKNVEKIKNRKKIPKIIRSTDKLVKYAFFREEYRGFAAFVWNKIIKKEFLEKNTILFDDSLSRGDDIVFFSEVALANPKTIYIDRCFYHYVQRNDSLTHTLTEDNMGRLSDILLGYSRAIDTLKKHNISIESLDYMKSFYVYHASVLYELAVKMKMNNKIEEYRAAMMKYLREYKNQNRNIDDRITRIEKLIGI